MVSLEPILEGIDHHLSWNKYCGFLELSRAEFAAIQEALLKEALELLWRSPLGRHLLVRRGIDSSNELRRAVPLTSYKDYEPFLVQKDESVLPEKPVFWAFTTTSAGKPKWAPYTRRAYVQLVRHLLGALILACAREKYDVGVTMSDRVLYAVAPSPFLSGLLARGLEQLGFRGLPPQRYDELGFHAAVAESVRGALNSGCDIMIAPSSVAATVADRISGASSDHQSIWGYLAQPRTLLRLARARLMGRLEGRPVLPRDLWKLKGLLGWGIDTSVLREKIHRAWGVEPCEFLACTEAGILAIQSWSKRAMTFVPAAAYLEFLPGREVEALQRDPDYQPTTVLMHDLEVGQRYEVVVTSFHAMPFLRYRTGLMVRVIALENNKEGIRLPQVELVGRSDGLIDIAGFTRLDERTLWDALATAGIRHDEWTARREDNGDQAVLALYIEVADGANLEEMKGRLHVALKERDTDYRDVEELLGMRPLEIRPLAPGTFRAYRRSVAGKGMEADLAGQVAKVSAPQEVIDKLVTLSRSMYQRTE